MTSSPFRIGDHLHLGDSAGGAAATLDGVEQSMFRTPDLRQIVLSPKPKEIHAEAAKRGLTARTVWSGEAGECIEVTRPEMVGLDSWVRRVVPLMTDDDWSCVRDERDPVPGSVIDGITYEQVSVLLAYRDVVANMLDEGDRVCLAICSTVPWVDIGGRARPLGLIDESGIRTPFGSEVSRAVEVSRG